MLQSYPGLARLIRLQYEPVKNFYGLEIYPLK